MELRKISAKEYLILCNKRNITVESGVDELLIYIRHLINLVNEYEAEVQKAENKGGK